MFPSPSACPSQVHHHPPTPQPPCWDLKSLRCCEVAGRWHIHIASGRENGERNADIHPTMVAPATPTPMIDTVCTHQHAFMEREGGTEKGVERRRHDRRQQRTPALGCSHYRFGLFSPCSLHHPHLNVLFWALTRPTHATDIWSFTQIEVTTLSVA